MFWLISILRNRTFLILLFITNLLGTIYGYIWYGEQLSRTPVIFLPFVPDSPTASLFFTIFLGFYIFGRHVPYIEALAMVTLFKYGVWAVVMNLLTLMMEGSLTPQAYMLIISHGAMAVQGLLYAPIYKFKLRHLMITGIWTIHNDFIDYIFEMMPRYHSLDLYMNEIGYFTFWLSLLSLLLAYYLVIKKKLTITYQ
ncbi:DUF1405 domain-containing protein [Amphibacillus sp. Q70]|uniref:DUF1405 domain-containing protein n=1 Tax=Amphibacillus sp. Q70 TaxID=3453416 RepID=UPI003F86D63B